MNIQSNGRTNARSRLIYSLRVFDDQEARLLGTVVDITPDGIMIRGQDPVPVGKELFLRMGLPTIEMADGQIKFSAHSKWCRKNKSGDYYSVGFQFVDLPNEAKKVVLRLIRNYCREEEDEDPELDMNPPLS